VELNNPSKTGGHQPPGYLLNKATAQDNLRGGSDHHEIILSHKTLEPSFKTCQVCFQSPNFQVSAVHPVAMFSSFWYHGKSNIKKL
jgi:hypothetical protein